MFYSEALSQKELVKSTIYLFPPTRIAIQANAACPLCGPGHRSPPFPLGNGDLEASTVASSGVAGGEGSLTVVTTIA